MYPLWAQSPHAENEEDGDFVDPWAQGEDPWLHETTAGSDAATGARTALHNPWQRRQRVREEDQGDPWAQGEDPWSDEATDGSGAATRCPIVPVFLANSWQRVRGEHLDIIRDQEQDQVSAVQVEDQEHQWLCESDGGDVESKDFMVIFLYNTWQRVRTEHIDIIIENFTVDEHFMYLEYWSSPLLSARLPTAPTGKKKAQQPASFFVLHQEIQSEGEGDIKIVYDLPPGDEHYELDSHGFFPSLDSEAHYINEPNDAAADLDSNPEWACCTEPLTLPGIVLHLFVLPLARLLVMCQPKKSQTNKHVNQAPGSQE